MFRIYLKTTLRVFLRNKGNTIINVIGLSLGMAIFIMIAIYVLHSLSNDSFHKNINRIARIETDEFVAMPMRIKLMTGNEIPEIEKLVRLSYLKNVAYFRVEGKQPVKITDMLLADPEVLDVFTFELVKGNKLTALKEPRSLIISETNARKLFGNENPMGRTIRYNNKFDMVVTGVMKDLPEHSSIWAGMITNIELFNEYFPTYNYMEDYNEWSHYAFVLLQENANWEEITTKLNKVLNDHIHALVNDNSFMVNFRLNPMKELYFGNLVQADSFHHGSYQIIKIYISVGLFILLIAIVNFINLANATAFKRSREIGLRKLSGAGRSSLLLQLVGESIALSLIALVFAFVLFNLLYPVFNDLTGANIEAGMLFTPAGVMWSILFAILTGILSGIYPAIFLAGFKPIQVLKGTFTGTKKGVYSRRALLMVQFFISVCLIIVTSVIYRQVRYMQSIDIGISKDNIIYFPMNGSISEHLKSFEAALYKIPGVQKIGITSSMPGYANMSMGPKVDGIDRRFDAICCDAGFIDMFDLKFVEGRNFLEDSQNDLNKAYVVNETFVKNFDLKSPLGVSVREGRIVGVVKDFNYKPANVPIGPLALAYMPSIASTMSVRVAHSDVQNVINEIEKTYNTYAPGFPFEYRLYDEAYDNLYKKEERMYNLFGYFAMIAILIACLGISGLTMYTLKMKTRELSIRRVFGAPKGNIIWLMVKDFSKWLLIAGIVAWPLAYYIMDAWLVRFAYRITPGVFVFLISTVVALILSLSVVVYHSLLISNKNPAVLLKADVS